MAGLMVNLAVNRLTFAVLAREPPVELHVSKLIEKYVGAPSRRGPSGAWTRIGRRRLPYVGAFIFLSPPIATIRA
jgi:hypothetical protein